MMIAATATIALVPYVYLLSHRAGTLDEQQTFDFDS